MGSPRRMYVTAAVRAARECPVSAAEQQQGVERFLAAVRRGDLQGLLDVLAPNVVDVSDGGGVAPAALRPVDGAERVARLFVRGLTTADLQPHLVWLKRIPGRAARHRW
jgi:hypothetical protein